MIGELRDGAGLVAVLGMGYVGLPLATALARQVPVIGFDINPDKINDLKGQGLPFEVSHNTDILDGATCFIIAVPTPIDDNHLPVLDSIVKATELVGEKIREGGYVIYESTVYPGCTEELCVPILERISGMKVGPGIKVCYSPERISPGDDSKDVGSIVKVISACDEEALDELEKLYGPISNGISKASSIRVAEMAKLVENVQRDVNISLINEFAMICDKLGIETHDVLEVAGTKWNFQKFSPGLVGGHCISVDPHYLVYKSEQVGHSPRVILSGRDINDRMPEFIAKKLIRKLIDKGKGVKNSRILTLGITFKPDVDDIRNSKVVDLIRELESFGMQVDVVDPRASSREVQEEYQIHLSDEPDGTYDAVIVAVPHREFKAMDKNFLLKHLNGTGIIMDINGQMKSFADGTDYWRL